MHDVDLLELHSDDKPQFVWYCIVCYQHCIKNTTVLYWASEALLRWGEREKDPLLRRVAPQYRDAALAALLYDFLSLKPPSRSNDHNEHESPNASKAIKAELNICSNTSRNNLHSKNSIYFDRGRPRNYIEMEQMTLAKALVELKLLDSRVEKARCAFVPVAIKKGPKFLSSAITSQEAFEQETVADWQKLRNYYERRRKIKGAILKANATTVLTIAGCEYTLAEAIDMKRAMDVEQDMLDTVKGKVRTAQTEVDRLNVGARDKLLKLLESMYAKRENQLSESDHEAVSKPFNEANEASLVDPIGIEKVMKDSQERIDLFHADVDVALSVCNATTSIEIPV